VGGTVWTVPTPAGGGRRMKRGGGSSDQNIFYVCMEISQ
jgi:hypothetical protein